MEKTSFLGIPLSIFTLPELAEKVNLSIAQKRPLTICNINIHAINQFKKNADFRKSLLDSDFVICDSDIIRILCSVFKRKKVYKLTGSRWIIEYLEQHQSGLRIFLLGDEDTTLDKSCTYISRFQSVSAIDKHNGFFEESEIGSVLEKINQFKPDILLVGMGMPKQEIFIDTFKTQLLPCVFVPVGGAFKYWAGIYKQAPNIILKLNLEWLHRIYQEPGRLLKRYVYDSFYFFINFIKHIISSRNQSGIK